MNLRHKAEHSRTERILDGLPSIKMIVSLKCRVFTGGRPESLAFSLIRLSTDTNSALHYYSDENVKTENGVMNITTELKENLYKAFDEKTKKFYVDTKHVQSAMVQGWNKFCVTGGIVEFSAKLPGKPTTGGLWPACKYRLKILGGLPVHF